VFRIICVYTCICCFERNKRIIVVTRAGGELRGDVVRPVETVLQNSITVTDDHESRRRAYRTNTVIKLKMRY